MRILFLYVFVLCGFQALCQSTYRFSRYTSDQGLVHNMVFDIDQDQYGFIWCSTPFGLSRFDGHSFSTFRVMSQKRGIVNIICASLNSQQQLWIGTDEGIHKFDYSLDSIVNLNVSPELDSLFISSIEFDSKETAWIGTQVGLFKITRAADGSEKLIPQAVIRGESILSLLCDSQNNVWVGTINSIYRIDLSDNQYSKLEMPMMDDKNSSFVHYIRDIAEGPDGDIYFASADLPRGIARYNPRTNATSYIQHNPQKPQSLINNGVFSLCFDENGQLWAGTDEGLDVIDINKNSFTHILHDPSDASSLSLDIVKKVFMDKDQRMWIGTFGGLSLWDKHSTAFFALTTGPIRSKNLMHGYVSCLSPSANNGFWIGTDGGGFSFFSMKTRDLTHFQRENNLTNGLASNKVLALCEDDGRGLWIGYWVAGLDYYDFSTKKFTNYVPDASRTGSLSNQNITHIIRDNKSRIWVATRNGLNRVERSDDKVSFTTFHNNPDNKNSLISDHVRFLEHDSIDDILYIGTTAGMSVMNIGTGTFTNYVHDQENPNSLANDYLTSIFIDHSRRIWVCTGSSGLQLFEPASGQFIKPNFENTALANVDLQGLSDDSKGNIWVSSTNGLYLLQELDSIWHIDRFTKGDGLHGLDFAAPATLTSNDIFLAFGGTNGVSYFFPEQIVQNTILPHVLFTKLELNSAPGENKTETRLKLIPLIERESITISDTVNAFTVFFSGIGYTQSAKTIFRYKLEGYSDTWTDLDRSRTATFTNLDPGNYTLTVIAANNYDLWTPEGATLHIRILPPWHKTKLAYIIYVSGLLALILAIIQLRTRNLHKSQLRLKREVEKQTEELKRRNAELDKVNHLLDEQVKEIETQNEEMLSQLESILEQNSKIEQQSQEIAKKNELLRRSNDDREEAYKELQRLNSNLEMIVEERTSYLKSTLEKLQKTDSELNAFLYRSSHDLKGPISSLLGLAMLARKGLSGDEIAAFLTMIEDTSAVMLRNLKKLQQVHLIFNKTPEYKKIDFDMLKESLLVFLNKTDTALRVSKEMVLDNPEGLELNSDLDLLTIILENIAENSIFFQQGESSYSKILLKITDSGLTLIMEDNGKGISSDGKKIFEMFYRERENSKGAGLGLYTAKSAIDKLNGTIRFTSTSGITRFVVDLPNQSNQASLS